MDLILKREADEGLGRWSVGIAQSSLTNLIPSGKGATKANAINDFLEEVRAAIERLEEAAKAAQDL